MGKLSKKKTALIIAGIIIILQTIFNRFSIPYLNNFLPLFSPTPTLIKRLIKVTKVIDGDTIVIKGGQKVRYIGINAPEIYRDTTGKKTGEQCFAKEATEENRRLVEGKTIRLEKDVSETDKYGRLLRYVYVDETFVNDYLVRQGFAKTMTIKPDTKYYLNFKQEEIEARENNRGLWKDCSTVTPTKPQ